MYLCVRVILVLFGVTFRGYFLLSFGFLYGILGGILVFFWVTFGVFLGDFCVFFVCVF